MAKRLALRRADVCAVCAIPLGVGTVAWWDAGQRLVWCEACVATPPRVIDLRLAAEAPVDHVESAAPTVPVAPEPIDAGRAGGSARRQYERRSARERQQREQAIADDAARRNRRRSEHPVAGRLVNALTPKPQFGAESEATRAWRTGAAGEEEVALALDLCADVIPLHDRRIPGTRANIDHLAVTASGVWVIDAKWYAGKVERRDVGGFLRTDERLYVGGRDRTGLVAAVVKQCDVVRTALHRIAAQQDVGLGVEVRGVLCFVGADWPGWRLKPPRIGGVVCVWPEALASLFRGAANPSAVIDQRAVAAALAAAFPPA
ncbi:MAG: nuclease-related domain-containing protein [Acidimicrobiales bacterium]